MGQKIRNTDSSAHSLTKSNKKNWTPVKTKQINLTQVDKHLIDKLNIWLQD